MLACNASLGNLKLHFFPLVNFSFSLSLALGPSSSEFFKTETAYTERRGGRRGICVTICTGSRKKWLPVTGKGFNLICISTGVCMYLCINLFIYFINQFLRIVEAEHTSMYYLRWHILSHHSRGSSSMVVHTPCMSTVPELIHENSETLKQVDSSKN